MDRSWCKLSSNIHEWFIDVQDMEGQNKRHSDIHLPYRESPDREFL